MRLALRPTRAEKGTLSYMAPMRCPRKLQDDPHVQDIVDGINKLGLYILAYMEKYRRLNGR